MISSPNGQAIIKHKKIGPVSSTGPTFPGKGIICPFLQVSRNRACFNGQT
ncbi:hypothetical protein SACS_1571 [Parasaccharibacter apium]|uniref:Uncharacterized protein n=1 Tax=Parasaccharibacter apium TaxID=1510841 RepID=A0A7U7J1E0_9PROT|nr:hypothetical protein SACS_1571 [Parasaccharibacter apium]